MQLSVSLWHQELLAVAKKEQRFAITNLEDKDSVAGGGTQALVNPSLHAKGGAAQDMRALQQTSAVK